MNYLAQVQRDRVATLRHDKFFVVRQRYYIGSPINRWAEDHTVIETGDFSEVIKVIIPLDGPKQVIAVDVMAGTSVDVSKAAALEVSSLIRNGEADLCVDLRDFIEEHFPVGSLLPAAT